FAVTFQRQKRAARTITTELLKIPKVGPTKRRALLTTFGSVQGVRAASVDDIAALPGFGPDTARHILRSLGVELPTSAAPAVPEPQPTSDGDAGRSDS
ncbi:MAG TPA: helix-hairpin-helix domain-containing protein, partial [Gemmatimonas sp.]|nr:helix-hairpin-helix domain-containing protein [Gemmatimonas sp.]